MNNKNIKEKIIRAAAICASFVIKNKRYFIAACIFICMNIVLFVGTGDKKVEETTNSAGVYKDFKENKSEELTKLINSYYKAYADGDTDAIQKVATPVCDQEISYIAFYSEYIESFNDIEIYTKPGLEKGSYLTSVRVNLKFKDIDTSAAGLDFFYVETNDDGKLYINNIYSSFNQNNNVYEMDTKVSDLISVFIRQQDLLDKEAEVTNAYEEALNKDEALKTFMKETLPSAIVQWNTDYNAKVVADAEAAAKAEEEAKAKAEEEEKAAAEEEAKANSYTGKTNAKVNVRAEASADSEKLGSLNSGKSVTIYGEEGDFYKVDYDGTTAYITKDGITVDSEDNQEETEETADTEETTNATYSEGEKITLSTSVNLRSKMDTSSSKVAVVHAGEKVEVVMSYAEGWTKVKYNKKEGYIRSDLLK